MRARAHIPTWTSIAVVVLGAAIPLTACGRSAPRPPAPVHLSALTPADGSRLATDRATIAGSVTPHRARVLVMGRRATTDARGHFSVTVQLQTGTNLIDVIAGAAHARPAMTAIRVVRYLLVSVPSVEGQDPRTASAAITSARLTAKVDQESEPFLFLVPLSERVCTQSPSAGARVAPGTTVTLTVGKICFSGSQGAAAPGAGAGPGAGEPPPGDHGHGNGHGDAKHSGSQGHGNLGH